MNASEIYEHLQQKFPEHIVGIETEAVDPWVEVSVDGLEAVCRYLKESPELRIEMLKLISAVDYCHTDPKKAAKAKWEPHLMLVYHLASVSLRNQVVLKVRLPRWKDDQVGQLPEAPSLASVWPAADWHEREVFDLSGVNFTGHPDPRRILCPDDWEGHPLRKDYEFPTEYHGVRCE